MHNKDIKQQTLEQYSLKSSNYESFRVELVDLTLNNLWRYHHFLPVGVQDAISMGEGFTPMLNVKLNNKEILIKQEQLFPTGSYKDRGAAVLMSYAQKMGVKHVVQDSSGNAGCSIAAYAANANIACDIFVPLETSMAKLAQIRAYGANLILVDGDREATAAAALLAAQKSYYASHCYNSVFLHGTKTFAYEVCEQLGWKAPDVVVLPAGNGTLVLGCYIGFKHLFESNVIFKMPKIVAVQAKNCAPLYNAWIEGLNESVKVVSGYTLAEGIAIADPIRGKEMISAVKNTQGIFVTVNDNEIIQALKLCNSKGYYIEPTSAATIAGLLKAQEIVEGETWVTLFSGHGLKCTEKILSVLDANN